MRPRGSPLALALAALTLAVRSPQNPQDEPNSLWLTVEDMSPWLAC